MGIQQKLHTKLVQKLILTPSLQQAIKLLPMSTLELTDLLNQEMVENPMLEEVPTEDLQPAEAAATQEKNNDPESHLKTAAYFDDVPKQIAAADPVPLSGLSISGWSGLRRVEYWRRPAADPPAD